MQMLRCNHPSDECTDITICLTSSGRTCNSAANADHFDQNSGRGRAWSLLGQFLVQSKLTHETEGATPPCVYAANGLGPAPSPHLPHPPVQQARNKPLGPTNTWPEERHGCAHCAVSRKKAPIGRLWPSTLRVLNHFQDLPSPQHTVPFLQGKCTREQKKNPPGKALPGGWSQRLPALSLQSTIRRRSGEGIQQRGPGMPKN